MIKLNKGILFPITLAAINFSCGNSSSSKKADPANTTQLIEGNTPPESSNTQGPPANESAQGEVLSLDGKSIEFKRTQYDCGNIQKPLSDSDVASKLKFTDIKSLHVNISGTRQILLEGRLQEENTACIYRARFVSSEDFSAINFETSQALTESNFPACETSKQEVSKAFSDQNLRFDYDQTFLSWVAVHIPDQLQTMEICDEGTLRAVFSAKFF